MSFFLCDVTLIKVPLCFLHIGFPKVTVSVTLTGHTAHTTKNISNSHNQLCQRKKFPVSL